jgi:hypothetical protein
MHVSPGALNRALRGAGHPAQVERLQTDRIVRLHQPERRLVSVIEPDIRLALFSPRKPLYRLPSLRVQPVQATPERVFFRRRVQRASVLRDHATMPFVRTNIGNQVAVRGGTQNVHAAVHPNNAACCRKWIGLTFALEDGPPTAVLLHDERPPKLGDRATFAKPHRSDAGYAHACLRRIELERTIAVREFQLLPARSRLEARKSGRLAALTAAKECRKRQIEPM